jgi:hypothetical protein
MKRYEVNSSEFRSMGYDQPTSTLETEYRSGDVYRYFDVPAQLVLEMFESESIGRFFNRRIRPKYKFKRVR